MKVVDNNMAIDSHMHINSVVLQNIQEYIEEINKNQSIRSVINVGLNIESSKESISISRDNPKFYSPNEVTPDMRNRQIRIIGGQLDGYIGTLVTTRGSKTKRLLVELPTLLAASVEVEPEYIQLV